MGRVIFLNRFYWPDEPATAQLLTDLAEALAARGREVAVVTSHPGLADLSEHEVRHGVQIHRVRSHRGAEFAAPRKALAFLTFHLRAARLLSRLAQPGDVVVPLTDPPLLTATITPVARRRRAVVLNWIQDIYPEVAVELTGHRWLRLLAPARNRAWRQSAACVTLGSDMAAAVAATGIAPTRIATIPNWAPAGVAPAPAAAIAQLRAEWHLAGKFVVAYSGNLGRVHDLRPVLDLAFELRNHPDLCFLFIGGGPQRASLQAESHRRGLTNVLFRSPVPRHQLSASLGVGDVHLVTLRPGCERFVFPSKLYGIAAAARPVLFIGPRDAEIARLVRQHAFGLTFARTETSGLASAISRLATDTATLARMREAAARFAAAHMLTHAVAAWEKQIDAARTSAVAETLARA